MTVPVSVRQRSVAAPPERVWEVLAAFDEISGWAANVDHSSRLTASAEGVGTARRVQVKRMALVETVTTWEPPTCLAYTLDGLPPLARSVSNRWDLAPAEGNGGGTSITLTSEIVPLAGPRARIGARILGLVLGRGADALVNGLADHFTSTGVVGAARASSS